MMNPRFSSFVVVSCIAICLLSCVGCYYQPEPITAPAILPPLPEQTTGSTDDGAKFIYIKWKEGLGVLVVDNYGKAKSRNTGFVQTMGEPYMYSEIISDPDQKLKWTIKSFDGIAGEFIANRQSYELRNGAFFVINPDGELNQIKADISNLESTEEKCREFVNSTLSKINS